jgi:hypothetical protein
MSTKQWTLQRGYVSHVYPAKGEDGPPSPKTYALKVDAEFRRVISQATNIITRRQKSEIVFKMDDQRQHAVEGSRWDF